jgi:ABC-type cobalt transport system substrate-binding protein
MPTGYTAALYEGKPTTFEEFTLNAARAMGAAIMQRDDAPGPIKEASEASSYHKAALENANSKLTMLINLSVVEWTQREKDQREENDRQDREAEAKVAAIQERYEAMLIQVEDWQPPTGEHEGLKKFMRDQLVESIEWDCRIAPRPERPAADPVAFAKAEIARAARDVEYHAEKLAEDEERAASRNKWVRDLKASLV